MARSCTTLFLIKLNSSQSSQDRAMESVSESYQKDAVNLVQQAFDEILLPEIQELSPDDQSVTSGLRSDEEVFEQGQVNGEERNVKEAKMTSKIGDKSDQKVSKKWSSLKKIFILKRFVKALDKVKRINRGTPRYLPLQPEPEAERVNLRRQMSEERKNTEEWMLDYALQQVVSKLDPAQQRRVAMLVKAFETVLPLPDLNSSPRLRVADRARVDPVQACSRLVAQNGDKPGKETEGEGNCTNAMIEKKLSRGLEPELSIPLSVATDKDQEEQFSAGNVDDLKSSEVIICADHPNSISDKSNSEETLSTCHEALQSGNVQEVRKQINVILSAEPGKTVDDSDEVIKFKSKTIDTVKENRQVFSDSIEPLADSVIARGKVNERSEPEESESDSTSTDASQDTQMEKQSYMRLWGFVYKHMMSSIVIEDGTKLDNESDGKTVDNVKTTQSLPIKDRDVGMKGSAADNERAVLRRIEAIKLIEKAIDDIILPDNQDSSTDGQATGSSDEEPQAEKSLVEGEQFDSDSTLSTNKSSREPSQEEAASYIVRENKERATLSNQGEGKASSEKKMSRNWSNVKKMILLKRFIKAFENARKFNPRGPRFLPLEADPEAEKVNLKHQEMDERKSAEEWMLDYAVQQAVARLTPARKRKVKLLVEAFETVTPTVRA